MQNALDELGLREQDYSQSQESLLLNIEKRISILLDTNIELLLSHLYRLDIPESDIDLALQSDKPIPTLAKTILNRQIERIQSKKKYNTTLDPEFQDLAW